MTVIKLLTRTSSARPTQFTHLRKARDLSFVPTSPKNVIQLCFLCKKAALYHQTCRPKQPQAPSKPKKAMEAFWAQTTSRAGRSQKLQEPSTLRLSYKHLTLASNQNYCPKWPNHVQTVCQSHRWLMTHTGVQSKSQLMMAMSAHTGCRTKTKSRPKTYSKSRLSRWIT